MSDEGVCRTAPAKPGLLITKVFLDQPLALPGSAKYTPKTDDGSKVIASNFQK